MDSATENKRILIVDDNKDIHEDFTKVLQQEEDETRQTLRELEASLFDGEQENPPLSLNCELEHAYQGDEALLKVSDADREGRPFALIYMDVRMPPGMDGIETIYRIWRKFPLLEMVICTAYSDYSWDEIITKLGSTDKLLFIKKPFNAVEIRQMTLSLLKKWNLNHKLNKLEKTLEEEVRERTRQLNNLLLELREKNNLLLTLARQDSLTGMLNHAVLYDQLNANLSAASRHEYPLIIVMLDIDGFREINSTCGHNAGDVVIKKVAEGLRESLRLYDVTLRYQSDDNQTLKEELKHFQLQGHYGGDEFICILPHCGSAGADSVATRIAEKINNMEIEDYPELKITTCLGICTLSRGNKCLDSRELIKLADRALCMSREKGRGRITYLKYEG